jgi:ABC-type lipoprotein release transport system permease subunit
MHASTLVRRSLAHYWRTHAAVVLGVAVAVAVLAGALLVGESLRASLRAQVLARLGRADHTVLARGFFREALAADLARRPGIAAACPLLALPGVVATAEGGRRAGGVEVWGVDARFWELHGRPDLGLAGRSALLSEALAAELGARAGDAVLLRVRADEDVSGGSLFGRRDDPARALRLTVGGVLGASQLGEFSLRPRQQPVKAVFVPLATLQRAAGRPGRANAVLVAGEPDAPQRVEAALAVAARLEDLGLRLRSLPSRGALALEAEGGILDDAVAETGRAAAEASGLRPEGVLVYLANRIRAGGRWLPYSTVAGVPPEAFPALADAAVPEDAPPPIVLNEWAARDLGAAPGDELVLDYYVWLEEGRLETRSAAFRVLRVVPIAGAAADRDLVPDYPGITESEHMADWDPPFPVELSWIRPVDEQYWERYRATPKAFVPLAVAQGLWRHRLGRLTSLRFSAPPGVSPESARDAFGRTLRTHLEPRRLGLVVEPVRALGLAAARGSTEFGAYFLYFSAFLVASAVLLAGLFYRLGVEQRLAEVGLLRALGFGEGRLRVLLLAEGLATSALGALLGAAGAAAWAGVLLLGLRTVWNDAVGTRELALHVAPGALLAGALGGTLAALLAADLTLRGLRRLSPRALLKGARSEGRVTAGRGGYRLGAVLAALSLSLVAAARLGAIGTTGAFFGAGALTLGALLGFVHGALAGRPAWARRFTGPADLGLRGAAYRPGRSVLSVALVATATFLVVAVGVFRRGAADLDLGPRSEGGGYALLATSLVPLHHDPATEAGREALGLPGEALEGARIERFRMRAGDDASCLNLYQPQRPTVLAPADPFLRQGRFAFQASLARTPEQRANPWLLLEGEARDGALPVIADANTLNYVLKKKLGDTLTLAGSGVTVRFVAALAPGLFQGELLTGEAHFLRAFPDEPGYRFFLVEAPPDRAGAVAEALESRLADFGFDAQDVGARLAAYHRVENTYISTFQTLGGLALVLGTLGLATVLLRNALEQRRELALLRAVGFRRADLARQLSAENALLLGLGLGIGTLAAALAVLPAALERGGGVPVLGILGLLAAVVLAGAVSTRLAVAAVARMPVLDALRSE